MARPLLGLVVAFLASTLSLVVAEEVNSCGLYLAETLDDQGRLTMGVFAGADISPGSIVSQNDVVVPMVDMPIHNSPSHGDREEWWWRWSNFVWDPIDVGGEFEGIDVKSAGLGMGSLVRGNRKFANVMLAQSTYETSGLHRSKDSGAGAFSYYPESLLVSTEEIPAGQELYFPNGYSWFLDPKDGERYPLQSLSVNHDELKDYIKLYHELEEKYGPEFTAEFRSKLWTLLRETPVDDSLRALLPASLANESNTAQTPGARSLEWLQENGICIDNIRQGPSTIPQAGKGAFATRDLSEGSVIAPAPLVHVWDRTTFDMFDARVEDDGSVVIDDAIVSKQLLLNYCFGHKTTVMLLCPIGPGTGFINHSRKPNAAIRWSTRTSSTNKEWLNMTDLELGDAIGIGLVLEYVALRDIQENEEIFIDYGLEWQAAWEQHMLDWNPLPESARYISASDMNMKGLEMIRTVDEQETEPYPDSVVTSCIYEYSQGDERETDMAEAMANQAVIKSWEPLEWGVPTYMFLRPCRVLAREDYDVDGSEDSKHTYTVQILNHPNMHDSQIIPEDETVIVTDVPREAIAFTDFLYTTDMHMHNTFRHEMIMDDAVFPEKWRYL